ncbi:MAG TPA: C-terminal binding protein [Firmicutes bacterium]|nr:C-terminal binding protein [Bacillota bacterium]
MSAIKVVVTDYIEPDLEWEREELAKLGDVDFQAYQMKFAPVAELLAKIHDADVIVVNMAPMTAEVIAGLKRCRLIIRHGIGYDNVDVAAATAKGITVANIPDYCPDEVAEQAIALIMGVWRGLGIGRRILEESSRRGQWDFSTLPPIHRLEGKTIGIVGFGRIGSRVYNRLAGFGVDILVTDPYLTQERRDMLGEKLVPLDELLRRSDVVTLHALLNKETHHMIGREQFKMMKKSAFLVNTARAGLVDTQALIEALEQGEIAGAGIDVYDKEPPPPDFPLFRMDNVVLSPHLGWCSVEAGWDIRVKIVEDIKRFRNGERPRFVVNPEVFGEEAKC